VRLENVHSTLDLSFIFYLCYASSRKALEASPQRSACSDFIPERRELRYILRPAYDVFPLIDRSNPDLLFSLVGSGGHAERLYR